MRLQIAIDMASTEEALKMVSEIHDVIDIVEVGTPMIMREGMVPVRMLKASFPNVIVLADCKIVDGGDIESGDAFASGADIVTVLGVADDATIQAVVRTARQHGRQVMVDMICIDDIAQRASQLDKMGVDYICLHTGVDIQKAGATPFEGLARLMPAVKNAKAAVAGGINLATIPLVKKLGPEIVVCGSALTKAPNLRAAVMAMQSAIKD